MMCDLDLIVNKGTTNYVEHLIMNYLITSILDTRRSIHNFLLCGILSQSELQRNKKTPIRLDFLAANTMNTSLLLTYESIMYSPGQNYYSVLQSLY